MEYGNVECCTLAAITNSAHVALSQYLLSFVLCYVVMDWLGRAAQCATKAVFPFRPLVLHVALLTCRWCSTCVLSSGCRLTLVISNNSGQDSLTAGAVLRGQPSQRSAPKKTKFLLSVTGHLGWKFSDYLLFLCLRQKLHTGITSDRQFFSVDCPPSLALPRWRCYNRPRLIMTRIGGTKYAVISLIVNVTVTL